MSRIIKVMDLNQGFKANRKGAFSKIKWKKLI